MFVFSEVDSTQGCMCCIASLHLACNILQAEHRYISHRYHIMALHTLINYACIFHVCSNCTFLVLNSEARSKQIASLGKIRSPYASAEFHVGNCNGADFDKKLQWSVHEAD